ncbi:lipopolysaccharide biosynthesis protein [Arthrobacter alpinus]|uniref:lipopolysaccharide biosynthesis protein n=1 Tax=Arthrobacter alpinus TaxID=656366 RepID=UPI001C9824DA|nr:lipopolysaccharide biosynthesis protein [Arthrobacter alpinus]
MTTEKLGDTAARGVVTTLSGQGLKLAIQVLSVVILARMLSPQDYGLVAMVAVIIGIADLFRDFGLSSAAIQAKTLSNQQRDNLFWLNAALGVVLAVIIFCVSPLIAGMYNQPKLVDISHVLAATFLLSGLATQYRADLTRRLKFAKLALADIIAAAIALLTAIIAASLGAGYWALIVQQLTQYTFMLVLVTASAGWLPKKPSRRTPMDGMIKFGWNLVATQLIGYLSKNIDSLVIGIRFGAVPLGLYSRAFQLLMAPLSQIRSPSTTVALPVLARLHDDEERFASFVQRGQLALGYTLVTGLGVVVGAGLPITELFLGQKWLSLAPVLSLLAAAGAFQTLAFVGYWVYLAKGMTKYLFRYSIAESAVTVACILIGSQWGIVGVAAGYAATQAIGWPLSLWWLSRYSKLKVRPLYAAALRIIAISAAMAMASHLTVLGLHEFPSYVAVIAALIAGAIVMALATLSIPRIRRDITGVWEIATRARRKG